jgi:activator of HSP90 ATPase
MKPNGDILKAPFELAMGFANMRSIPAIVLPLMSRRWALAAGAATLSCAATHPARSAESTDRVSRTAEALHQEPVFRASRHRVYGALTKPEEFNQVMARSDALKSKAVEAQSAVIDARPGGAFALFGGYVSGRFIELVPDALIVQAWRAGSWPQGVYSVARFELRGEGTGSRIVFDHTGFPVGQADHLAAGWYANYWNPLREVLQ